MSLVRITLLGVLVACGTSAQVSGAADGAAPCELGVRYVCDCGGGRDGWSTCGKDATRGGCDCGGAYDTTDDDGGAPDANCAAPTTFYRDLDGDGFGSGIPTPACRRPANYSTVDGDCDDADARAFPGQTAFFDTPRPGGSFDFDCTNSPIEKRWPLGGGCDLVPVLPTGWECRTSGAGTAWSGAPPACGVTGAWFIECLAGCAPKTEPRTQACR